MGTVTLGRVAPTIPVSNVERARQFYVDVFGFSVTFENGDPVGFLVLKKDEAELHLTLVKGHRGATHNVAHMMVSDADEVHRRCIEAGARIIKGLRDAPWGLRTFVATDPDGNRLDIGQRLKAT